MSNLSDLPAGTSTRGLEPVAVAGNGTLPGGAFTDADEAAEVADNRPAGSTEKVRGKFRFKITAEGLMLLVIVMLVGFAAWHSGTNLLYLVFSLLVAVYLLHGLVLSVNLSGLTITEDVPAMAVTGQVFDVTITARNRKRWVSSHSIRVSHGTSASRETVGVVHIFQVPRKGQSQATYSGIINRRGIFHIDYLTVGTRYPFGFEERAQIYPRDWQILVLPQTYPVAAIAALVPTGFGDQESQVRGAGTDLYGLREYVAGEPARHVHWRTSARAQKLMIAEYTREERRQMVLILDNALSAGLHAELYDAFENAVTLTASLARHLMESGYEVGLVTQEVRVEPGQGNAGLKEILRALALVQLTDNLPLPPNLPGVRITFSREHMASGSANGLTVDSTAWQPPADPTIAGEKVL